MHVSLVLSSLLTCPGLRPSTREGIDRMLSIMEKWINSLFTKSEYVTAAALHTHMTRILLLTDSSMHASKSE